MCLPAALSPGWTRRLLRDAAAQAASQCKDSLSIVQNAQLSSGLLRALSSGAGFLSFDCAQPVAAQVPDFLRATRISRLHVIARTLVQSAQWDQQLPLCDSVTSLECHSHFMPCYFPPRLTHIRFTRFSHDDVQAVEQAQILVVRLASVASLQHLELHTPATVCLPAGLAVLPASLQTVRLSFHLRDGPMDIGDDSGDDMSSEDQLDLGLLSSAAGCTACVSVKASTEECHNFSAPHLDTYLLPGLRAIAPFDTLWLGVNEACMADVCVALVQIAVKECTLCVQGNPEFQEHAPIVILPTCSRLNVCFYMDEEAALTIAWAALSTTPGVRCFGSEKAPLVALLVTGFDGLMVHAEAWALVVYGLELVTGLPNAMFVEEAPGKHVWRNAAAAGMDV